MQAIEQALHVAVAQHQAGQLEGAEKLYRAILQISPNHPEANHNLGVVSVQVKQAAAGLPYFIAALDADPARGQYWLSYIDALIQADQLEDARQVLELARQHGLQGDEVEALALRLNSGVKFVDQPGEEGQQTFDEPLLVLPAVPSDSRKKINPQSGRPNKPGKGYVPHSGKKPSREDESTLVALFNKGRFKEAAATAQVMTQRFPLHGGGWKAWGAALQNMGRNADSLLPMQKAATLLPGDAEAYNNLGSTFRILGRLIEAETCYRRALQINPEYAAAHNSLGITLHDLGRLAEAEINYRRALQINPDSAEAFNNLGVTLYELGRLIEAEAGYRRALQINPEYADAHSNLGALLRNMSRLVEAETSYRKAIQIRPDFAEAFSNLGSTLQDLCRPSEAEASYRRALQIKPDLAEAHSNLGSNLQDFGRLDEAEASFRRALQIKPDLAEAHSNLGSTLQDLGRLDEAEASYRRALEINPDYTKAHSNLLFLLNYTASRTAEYCLAEARQYGRNVSDRIPSRFNVWPCAKQSERLRIGFVSGDFRSHPVGYFLEGLLTHIDRTSIELFAYPTDHKIDDLTARIKPHFAAWKPIFGLSDEMAARQINSDCIHVLLDLSGHTSGNRLPVFSWKPAPVQASWLGYFATTGLPEIDYLLGDRHVAPVEESNQYTEQLLHFPETYLCFTKPDVDMTVAELPALSAGCITFGCFNNLTKMNDVVVEIWARILTALPESKLFLKCKQLNDVSVREATSRRFYRHGISAGRLILEGASPRAELLAAYHRVDIALDPFPYPGGTTSVEGLWMGVPVVTKRGDRFLSHVGETIAHNSGMSDWIASDADDYIAKAVRYASNIEQLANIRAGLRQQVLASPLFDAARFARYFEEAMWTMWERWHEKKEAS